MLKARIDLPCGCGINEIKIVDIQFGFEERCHQFVQPGRCVHFDDEQFAFREGKTVFLQEIPGVAPVICHQADNRAIGGVPEPFTARTMNP